MAMDVENQCGAAYGERSGERQNSRNGYRERLWETRAGSIPLKIPKLRSGSFVLQRREPDPQKVSSGGRGRQLLADEPGRRLRLQ